MNRRPLTLAIPLTPWRVPEWPIGRTALMEDHCRRMKPDRVHWPALLDSLLDDGLAEHEAVARLQHLSHEAVQFRDLANAMALLTAPDGQGEQLIDAILGDAGYVGGAVHLYVVPGYCRQRLHGPSWVGRWNVSGPCVVIGARSVTAMSRGLV